MTNTNVSSLFAPETDVSAQPLSGSKFDPASPSPSPQLPTKRPPTTKLPPPTKDPIPPAASEALTFTDIQADLASQVEADQIQYFLNFEEGNWLALESFSFGLERPSVAGGGRFVGGKTQAEVAFSLEETTGSAKLSLLAAFFQNQLIGPLEIVGIANDVNFGSIPVAYYTLENAAAPSSISFDDGKFELSSNLLRYGYLFAPPGGSDETTFVSDDYDPVLSLPGDLDEILSTADSVLGDEEYTHYVKIGESSWIVAEDLDITFARSSSEFAGTGSATGFSRIDSTVKVTFEGSSNELTAAIADSLTGQIIPSVEIVTAESTALNRTEIGLTDLHEFENVILTSYGVSSTPEAQFFEIELTFADYSLTYLPDSTVVSYSAIETPA